MPSALRACLEQGQVAAVLGGADAHRRDLDKIDRIMRKSIEAGEKAAYYASRAASAASNRAISSDDPDAVERLEAKLAKARGSRPRW